MPTANLQHPQKILIIRLTSIGDIILSFPLIRSLKQHFPLAQIDFLVAAQFEELLQPVRPLISSVIPYDKTRDRDEIRRLRNQIKGDDYDFILDIHNNLRSRRLLFGLRVPVFRIRKYLVRRCLYVKFGWKSIYPEIPVYRKYLRASPVKLPEPVSFEIEDFHEPEIEARLRAEIPALSASAKSIILFPGARHFTKRWPLEYYEALIRLILKKTAWNVIIGGDAGEAEYIRGMVILSHPRVTNICGKYSLLDTIVLIRHCDFVVSNDSAPMHIAALFGKPQVAIFGNTHRRFGFAPLNPTAVIIENNDLKCRPCSHIGFEKCPKGHLKCLREISPERVFDEIIIET